MIAGIWKALIGCTVVLDADVKGLILPKQSQGQATYILIYALSRSRSARAQCTNITANIIEKNMAL